MKNRSLAKRYASALMELAVEKDVVDQVNRDLLLIYETIHSNDQLAETIFGQFTARVKQKVVSELFASRVNPLTMKFVEFVIAKHREDELDTIIEVFGERVRAWKNIIDVEVSAAVRLTDSDLKDLKRQLETMTGKTVILKVKVAPELLGGLQVKIGDLVLDGTLAAGLRLAARQLLTTSV